jgi:SAM-dependent methyltransferase
MTPDAIDTIYQRLKRSTVIQDIAPDDEMWLGAPDLSFYFSVGESAVLAILRALAIGSLQKVETILDLPCGHGREARYLCAAFPEASFTFCDLYRTGVDFCTKTFGGRGVYSVPDLTQVRLGGPFDIIWVGSLFTHIDQRRTAEWMKFLCECLSEDGVLVGTFHGPWAIEVHRTVHPLIDSDRWPGILRDFERTGYGYADYGYYADYPSSILRRGKIIKMINFADKVPGGRILARRFLGLFDRAPGYGVSLSKPEKIIEIAGNIPGVRILSYSERGWADFQDVLALARTDRLKPFK